MFPPTVSPGGEKESKQNRTIKANPQTSPTTTTKVRRRRGCDPLQFWGADLCCIEQSRVQSNATRCDCFPDLPSLLDVQLLVFDSKVLFFVIFSRVYVFQINAKLRSVKCSKWCFYPLCNLMFSLCQEDYVSHFTDFQMNKSGSPKLTILPRWNDQGTVLFSQTERFSHQALRWTNVNTRPPSLRSWKRMVCRKATRLIINEFWRGY